MTTKRLRASSGADLEARILKRPMTFGDAVEALRKRDAISQVAFAIKLGVTRQYLCDVERGRRLVSPSQAARFAKAFGHPPQTLVQISLQDAVRASGLHLTVTVAAA